MTPRMTPNSKIANKYVSFTDRALKNANTWLEGKREEDGAEGLWRVHDNLYDMTNFVNVHPGGKSWLTLTKGSDITEAYETHHLNIDKTNAILAKFHVRKAAEPRNIKFTFAENGFYQTLKRRVFEHLNEADTRIKDTTKLMSDGLLMSVFVASILATYYPLFIPVASLMMSLLLVSGHNYFHQRDNFRMYYFNLSMMSFMEWRVSHALSHHAYTNSLVDMELIFLEPMLCWQPNLSKGFVQRFVSWVYGPIVYSLFFVLEVLKRFFTRFVYKETLLDIGDLVPASLPIAMYVLGAGHFGNVLLVWIGIIFTSSLIFAFTGLNAGHHHPHVFHDGDSVRENLDWGAYQLDTVIDREDLKGNHFLVLTNFGDHILHHLYPTLDHGYLGDLYTILYDTVNEFGLEARSRPWSNLIIGQHQQLARTEPSTRLINEQKKSL